MNEPVRHQPDFPFGCVEQWGTGHPTMHDVLEHVCNLSTGHRGDHRCACGKQRRKAQR